MKIIVNLNSFYIDVHLGRSAYRRLHLMFDDALYVVTHPDLPDKSDWLRSDRLTPKLESTSVRYVLVCHDRYL